MPRLIEICPTCKKIAKESWRSKDNRFLECGHVLDLATAPEIRSEIDFTSRDGKKSAYQFQREGVEFILRSNVNCLIADAMGLGKTIQAILGAREAMETLPAFKNGICALIIVPAAVTYNWIRESFSWFLDENEFTSIMPIQGRNAIIPPGFKFYIISRDSLAGNIKSLLKIKFNLVIVDECHGFKDISAQRTKALMRLLTGTTPDENKDVYRTITQTEGLGIPHKIFLSGTPIKNRAEEYFTILNLLDPVNFPSYGRFRALWLDGPQIKSWKLSRFHEVTSKYILRREKTDVLKNLPPFTRNYEWVTITDPQVKSTYNSELKQFRVEMLEGMGSMQMLGWLTKMRRLTAMAKLEYTHEYINQWQENAKLDKEFDPDYPDKLLIGVHHEDVVNSLKYGLIQWGALSLTGKDDAIAKQRIVDSFTNSADHKILVCSMLAGGVGLNIQCAPNIITVERQWSAADEEQFEARSWRDGQKYPVTNTILMAQGTIDQFFHEKVETKRAICADTLGYDLSSDSQGIKELVWKTLDNPL